MLSQERRKLEEQTSRFMAARPTEPRETMEVVQEWAKNKLQHCPKATIKWDLKSPK